MKDQTEYRRPERTDLPFVSERKNWDVVPTGNDAQDRRRGREYFRELVAFAEQCENTTEFLNLVHKEIIVAGQSGPIEEGFIEELDFFGLAHHHSLRYDLIECNSFPIVYPGHTAPENRPWRLPAALRQSSDLGSISPEAPANADELNQLVQNQMSRD